MKHAWTNLVAIASLIAIVTAAPVGAFEVRPDKNLTGGSVRTVKPDEACGHAGPNRHPMTRARQDEVLRRYKLPPGPHPDYEIDHLIPLCLGGSDDPSNLWPQPLRRIEETWNAEAKDRLERRVCDLVCSGQIDIGTAQEAFASDWIAAYQTYFEGRKTRQRPPVGANGFSSEAQAKAHCPTDTVVGVNLTSKIYHFNRTRSYGNTKNGEYMCESDTAAAGMRPAKNETHP
jgi:hypothetical protein